ncbi:MAG: hypothetical protein IJW70_09675 [Clostridia bacterium]|nr:hypothetical protein [Clostridia bacterium]
MGFGILFLAYFLAFFVPLSYLHIIGYAAVAWALLKLKDYRPQFMKAVWWLIPLGICCLYHVVNSVLSLLPSLGMAAVELPFINQTVTAVVSMVESVLILCFHFSLLRTVRGFASELELPAIAKRADWGLWLVSIQSTCYVVALILELASMELQLFSLIAFLLQFVWSVYNMINIFTCYMYICPEGDEDMERKPSRFAFVNEFREKMDERDRRAREKETSYMERKRQNKKKKHK